MKTTHVTYACFFIFSIISCNIFKDPNNGPIKEFNENGTLKTEYNLVNGKREGELKEYDENGFLAVTVEFKNDKRNGKLTNWSQGKQSLVTYFENDTQQGSQYHYYENGKIFKENHFVHGKLNGITNTFWPDGKLKSEVSYKDGMPAIGLKEYSQSGKEIVQPSIKITEIDQMALLNKYIIKIYLSEPVRELKYYEGKLQDNKYFPDKNYSHKLKDINGILIFEFPVERGTALKKEFNITAKFKTKIGNTIFLHKNFNIFVTNT